MRGLYAASNDSSTRGEDILEEALIIQGPENFADLYLWDLSVGEYGRIRPRVSHL